MGLEEKNSALRVHLTLEIERVGDCVRTDAVILKQIFELQRVLIHLEGWRPPQGRVWNGYCLQEWMAVDCWLVKEAMSSLSSSCVVVYVSVSSPSPSSSGGAQIPVAGGSVYETGEKPLLSY